MKWYEAILAVAAAAWLYRRLRQDGASPPRHRVDSHEATLRAYRQAVRVAPDDAGAHCGMAQALYDLGRYDEALESFGRAAELDPGAATDIGRGMALLRLGRHGEALESLDKARPGDANLHYSRGCALARIAGAQDAAGAREHYGRAADAFEEVLRLDPHHSDAALALDHVKKRMEPAEAAA